MNYRSPLLAAWLCSMSLGAALAQPSFGPSDGPGAAGHPPHGAPPEAVAACKDKALGAACSFTGRRQESLSGSCANAPSGPPPGAGSSTGSASSSSATVLACRPSAPAAPPQR